MSKDPQDPQDQAAEELVARVRAADPAAQAEPDLGALRAAVDAARAADATRADDVDGPVDPVPAVPDELAARRARRWTGWPARVAGVAAAAVLLGGGGYALGAAQDGDSGSGLVAGGAAPAISLQSGAGADGGNAESMIGAQDEGSKPAAAPRLAGGGDSAYWGGSGRTVFTASGLSSEPTSLHGHGFDSVGAFTQDAIARAAAALGVPGTPELRDGSWIVGPNDGTGPSVSLYPDGTVTLSYYDPGKDPYSCVATTEVGAAEPASPGGATSEGSTDIAPVPDPCEQRDLGAAPEGEAAAAVVRDALSALGVDPASFELTVDHTADSPEWTYVTAFGVLDGQRTGLSWNAQLTGAGLQSLYGSTAALVDLGEYPVISPVEAVQRLTDPRFGSGWFGPMFRADDGMVGAAADTAVAPEPVTPTVPPSATPGTVVAWPVDHATIVQARLGLALQTQPDGVALLVPSYELTSDTGDVWTVIAVADSSLDFGTD